MLLGDEALACHSSRVPYVSKMINPPQVAKAGQFKAPLKADGFCFSGFAVPSRGFPARCRYGLRSGLAVSGLPARSSMTVLDFRPLPSLC